MARARRLENIGGRLVSPWHECQGVGCVNLTRSAYCSNACKQKAYRNRQRRLLAEAVEWAQRWYAYYEGEFRISTDPPDEEWENFLDRVIDSGPDADVQASSEG